MTEQTTKVLKLKTFSPPSFQLMPFWPNNIEAWFCYAEADFSEHGVIDTRAQFLAVVKALPREFNRYITPSMFTSDVSEPYETLKRSILKRGDLTDRQRLDQLLNNIDLQHGWHRRPFESEYEGPFKVLQREPKYYIIDKNGINDSISIDRLKAAYLEGNPIYVDFPSVQSHDTAPLIIPQSTTNTRDVTPNVSKNKLKTTRSGRRVRFPEHLNDYCT
ncbi:hypothetical protein MS3_00001976 [Schistosoma haematobium]|uniref:DUF7041 domain-containing protein n=1 Tax=Schistosoma haematobium TaxID=6185 RepID=A0A922S710_SCHHA|nr:hypothetical protein MS3_00001976 [Schistosoma haematobium]KAH9596225.1 hypothetical protein MS3_00001976 [Schistosoma haematobium]